MQNESIPCPCLFEVFLFWVVTQLRVVLYRRFGTNYQYNLQGSRCQKGKSFWRDWPLKIGPLGSPETSAPNHLTLRNNLEDRRLHFNRGWSLRSLVVSVLKDGNGWSFGEKGLAFYWERHCNGLLRSCITSAAHIQFTLTSSHTTYLKQPCNSYRCHSEISKKEPYCSLLPEEWNPVRKNPQQKLVRVPYFAMWFSSTAFLIEIRTLYIPKNFSIAFSV